jgi:hypothetical protein
MAEIKIKHEHETPVGWSFNVEINGREHTLDLDREYWQQITHGHEQPAHLIKRSVEFLLQREKPEEILQRFDLRQIKDYFPEFEDTIDHRK